MVTVVRHAQSVHRETWAGHDAERPLDPVGRRQAESLAGELFHLPVRRLLASPTVRGIDTLAPFAKLSRLPVDTSPSLGVQRGGTRLTQWLLHPSMDGTVICTHGEVMRTVLRWLEHLVMSTGQGPLDDTTLLGNASAWLIELQFRQDVSLRHVTLQHVPAGGWCQAALIGRW